MENYDLRYGEDRYGAASAPVAARTVFLQRTYGHLFGAILGFVGLLGLLFASGAADQIVGTIFTTRGAWLGLMVLFVAGGYAAQYMAQARMSKATQYLGLIGYVVLEAIIFLPIIWVANARFPDQYLPLQAGVVTLVAFAALTLAVWTSGANFSFLGPILWVASLVALAAVVMAVIFGFTLGLVFSVAMIVLASGWIVYSTSNVLHVHGTDEYVAASLSLFASVALMFYYVLRLFMFTSNND